MTRSRQTRPAKAALYLGYTEQEQASLPWARWFRPELAALPANVTEALAVGAVAQALLPEPKQAPALQEPGYLPIETGYTRSGDGGGRVAVLNTFPGVTPEMWDWWFGWHGSDASRYKLWHPQAHVDVSWKDGRDDPDHYVGRVSQVVEYVGAERMQVEIAFVSPACFGFDEARLQRAGEVIICAEIFQRIAGLRVRVGVMAHQLRPIPGGCEMRSRFWLGGKQARLFGIGGKFGEALGQIATLLQPVKEHQLRELLVHDAQEMNHLAAILPELYQAFGPGQVHQTETAA